MKNHNKEFFQTKIVNSILVCFVLAVAITTVSCSYSKESMERRAKHQARTGERINESQRNTDSLFDEME